MKSYIFDGIMGDFVMATLKYMSPASQTVAQACLDDTRQSDYLAQLLKTAGERHVDTASRLALWGRKIVADTIRRGRDILANPAYGMDATEVKEVMQVATANHSRRMSLIGFVA